MLMMFALATISVPSTVVEPFVCVKFRFDPIARVPPEVTFTVPESVNEFAGPVMLSVSPASTVSFPVLVKPALLTSTVRGVL